MIENCKFSNSTCIAKTYLEILCEIGRGKWKLKRQDLRRCTWEKRYLITYVGLKFHIVILKFQKFYLHFLQHVFAATANMISVRRTRWPLNFLSISDLRYSDKTIPFFWNFIRWIFCQLLCLFVMKFYNVCNV